MWWLASSADGSRLLHIKTLGGGYDQQDPNYCIACHTAASSSGVVHCGRTVCTYAASGFGCLVFSMDTSQLVPANSCEMLVNQWEICKLIIMCNLIIINLIINLTCLVIWLNLIILLV